MAKMNGGKCIRTKDKDERWFWRGQSPMRLQRMKREFGFGGVESVAEFQRQKKLCTVAWFLHSAPSVAPCPLPQSRGRKRDIESDEETAPEANDIWVVETLRGLKMKLKRQRVSSVLPEHHEAFSRLLGRNSTLQPYSFFLKTQETSNGYAFPVENNSLQVAELSLSILGGLHTDPSSGTLKNDRGMRKLSCSCTPETS